VEIRRAATMDEAAGQIKRAVLTLRETAELLGVDVRTVSRACSDGQLPCVQVGRRRLIPRDRLFGLLEARPSGTWSTEAWSGSSQPRALDSCNANLGDN
jgi:excisionase family DNA binding protein